MSFKLGHINENNSALIELSNAVKIDILDSSDVEYMRASNGALSGVRKSNRANIIIELDFVSQQTLGLALDKSMNNRAVPHKLYLHEPADSTQVEDFTGITNPSITNKVLYGSSLNPDYFKTLVEISGMVEISSASYVNLMSANTYVLFDFLSPSSEYRYIVIEFNISAYIAKFGIEYIKRLTLFFENFDLSDKVTDKDYGYLLHCFNFKIGDYTEIKRQSITTDSFNQQFSSLRPLDAFTNFDDYVENGIVRFRFRQKEPIDNKRFEFVINRMWLYINGFGVVKTNEDNLNWRDRFTGTGHTGTIELAELL